MWLRVLNYSIYLLLFWSLANLFGVEIKINWEVVGIVIGTIAYIAAPFYLIKKVSDEGETLAIKLVNFLFGNNCYA